MQSSRVRRLGVLGGLRRAASRDVHIDQSSDRDLGAGVPQPLGLAPECGEALQSTLTAILAVDLCAAAHKL